MGVMAEVRRQTEADHRTAIITIVTVMVMGAVVTAVVGAVATD